MFSRSTLPRNGLKAANWNFYWSGVSNILVQLNVPVKKYGPFAKPKDHPYNWDIEMGFALAKSKHSIHKYVKISADFLYCSVMMTAAILVLFSHDDSCVLKLQFS